MNNFQFHNPVKIIFGKDSISRLKENILPFGKKVLLTYGGGSIKRNGIYKKTIEQLSDFDVKEFGGIEPNPRVETVRKIIHEFKKFDPDFILAVGGGSVVDATKLLASAMHYDGDPWDFLKFTDVKPEKYVPFGVILTLSATGSEMNSGSVITNWTNHEKLFFRRNETYPVFSILDPEHTYSVPKDQTAYGIIDTFSHVLEQYLHTTTSTPLQDRFSEGILLTLIENANIVLEDPHNYNARSNIMLCACMALNTLIGSGVNQDWATHNIEHEISAFYDIPHAAGLAIITPRWMDVVKETKKLKFIQYGKRIWGLTGEDDYVINEAISRTFDFFQSLNVKMTLKEWDISEEHFPIITKRLTESKIGEFPLNSEQIENILVNSLV